MGGEEVSELMGQPGVGRRCVRQAAELGAKPSHDLCNPGLCVEALLSRAEGFV